MSKCYHRLKYGLHIISFDVVEVLRPFAISQARPKMASNMAVEWPYIETLTRSLIVDLFEVLECLIKLILITNAILFILRNLTM